MAYYGTVQFSTTNMVAGYEIVEQKGILRRHSQQLQMKK